MSDHHVYLITGANSGVGLALAKRLFLESVQNNNPITLVLGCRSMKKAEIAKNDVLASVGSDLSIKTFNNIIELLEIDVSSPSSVYKASQEFAIRFKSLDILYLNAGIMLVQGVNWGNLIAPPKTLAIRLLSGQDLLNHVDYVTEDGLKGVFASNVFGHFILANQLLPLLAKSKTGKIVWTSSDAANDKSFNIEDIQHARGTDPYGASKYAIDLVSFGLNRKLHAASNNNPTSKPSNEVISLVTCPGLVTTQMTEGIMPPLFWTLLIPLLFLIRLFLHNITTLPYNGAEALFWISKQPSSSFTSQYQQPIKYKSRCTVLGNRYVEKETLKLNPVTADRLVNELAALAEKFRK